jgi:DNA modification methylase
LDIYQGEALEVLRFYPDNYFSSIVTDPPYGLSGSNSWDDKYVSTFREDTWAEMLRVLRPDGFLVSFCGDKTYHRMATAIENAGFEIINMLAWIYAQGNAKQLDRLKPALEPICLARKSKEATLNIKVCRFPVRGIPKPKFPEGEYSTDSVVGKIRSVNRTADPDPTTRYPSNVLISDDSLLGEKAPFFFCGKPTAAERGDMQHTTLKTIRLMRWLVRLTTPKGGIVLDPYMGGGTTGIAALEEGCDFVGIELRKSAFNETKERFTKYINRPADDPNDPMTKIKEAFDKQYG